jgi:hypothetical protein
MSSRKKQNKKSSGSLLLLVGIIVLISFIVSIFEYIVSAIAIASIILILLLGIGMIAHGYKELKLQEERIERENGLQEECAERTKQKEIERNAMKRNAELKYQDKEDNYKHYLDLHK